MRWLALLLAVAGCAGDPPLTVGQQVEGTLTRDDEEIHPGAVVDVLQVHLEAGEAAAVVVTSDDLAPFVIVSSRDEPLGAASGVAAGPGACVAVDADEALDLQVYISTAGGRSYGTYRLALAPFSHEFAAQHGCDVRGPGSPPEPPGPTFTAGSRLSGDHDRLSLV